MPADPQPPPLDQFEAPASSFRRTHAIGGRRSSRNVQLLIDSMMRDGWVGPPISVVECGGDLYVLNGHHRTYAARIAGLSVRYRAVDADELSDFGYRSVEQVVEAHVEAGPNRIRLRRPE
jgi:ParB-like chromosome segregation protein Spo0J